MRAVQVLFALFGVVAVGTAVLAVTTRHVVHAALWLVVTLGALAGCYLLVTAEFVAWVQVLIYVGAVVVLLLFALMLTRAPTGPVADLTKANAWFAGIVAVAVAAVLGTTMVAGFAGEVIDLQRAEVGSAKVIGDAVFSTWVLPFEVLSVLLLAALVGAIALSTRASRSGPASAPPTPAEDTRSADVADAGGGR